MNTLYFLKSSKIIMLVLAVITIFSAVAGSIAVFTDRANRTTTVQVSSFDDEGYAIERTAQEGYFTAGETVEVTLTESNEKSKDITSEITMTAAWDSPVSDIDPWTNTVITFDDENVSYTVNEDDTISFTLPKHELTAGSSNSECILRFKTPSDLATTGNLKFSFEQIELKNKGWNTKYDNSDLSDLECGFGIAWNISQTQTTSLGNPNRDIIAVLVEGDKDAEYGLHVMKNPYSNDDNTNNGAMMDWTANEETPWADYTIMELTIGEDVTTVGDYAFAGETGITSVTLPNTITHIGTSAFDGSGLTGELDIPASVSSIESLAFGNLPNVTTIVFEHVSDDGITLPDNESEGKETSGAFYVSDYVKTTINFKDNADIGNYNWVADNRMKVGISEVTLNYDEVKIGETVNPSMIIGPNDYDEYQSIKFEVVSGSDYVEIDEDTGAVTGKAIGTATIQVTIVDANGDTIKTTATISITAVVITSASLSYENVAVGGTVDPTLIYDPAEAEVVSKTFEITAGSNYAKVDASTGVVTGKANGVSMVKVVLTDEAGKETIASCVVTVGTPAAGTRYVWEQATVTKSYSTSTTSQKHQSHGTTATSLEIGGFAYLVETESGWIEGSEFTATVYSGRTITFTNVSYGGVYWKTLSITGGNNADLNNYLYWVASGTYYTSNIPSYIAGTKVATLSSASSSAFSNGVSGSYYYTYQGADNIDADSVTYSSSSVTTGDTITVTVAPSTKNVYGGTISYRYEYSTDSGKTWATASTTTETSLDITVPNGAETFIARVRANDNWGFTSSVYVYGSSVTVKNPLTGIAVTTNPATTTYTEGDSFDITGMVVTATYTDGSTKEITGYKVTNGDNLTLDQASVTISYTEDGTTKTADVPITVGKVPTPISSVTLTYPTLAVGSTVNPTLTYLPSDALIASKTYSISSGSSYATIDTSTGVLTGTKAGIVTVKVSVVDSTGATVTGTCIVTVGSPTADVRYVWSKYNTTTQQQVSGTTYTATNSYTPSYARIFAYDPENDNSNYVWYSTVAPTVNASGKLSWSSKTYVNRMQGSTQLNASTTYYFGCEEYDTQYVKYTGGSSTSIYVWEQYDSTAISGLYVAKYQSASSTVPLSGYTVTSTPSYTNVTVQGSTNYGYVASASNSTYPTNGASDSYWYVYQGSDSIDPTAVSYSTTSPIVGSSVTAKVTARSNTYGGTISYKYEYSTDGGATWTSGGTTTSTSKEITVPSAATSFMVRVKASDNLGFTSANYVYGANLIVN